MGATGTVIHVAAGTYSTITGCPNDSQANVCVNRSGSSTTARLIVQCDAGLSSAYAAQGQCKISGGDAGFFVANGNYVDIVGFDIGNTGNMATGVKVLDDGATVSAIGNSIHVIGNYIHDLGSTNSGGCPQNGAILFAQNHGSGTTGDTAIGNIITRYGQPTSGTCNYAHGIYANTGHVILENNIIVGVPTYGITFYSSACFGVVSNNVIITAKGGIVIGTDSSHGTACTNQGSNTINNNYFGNITTKASIVFDDNCTSGTPNFLGNNVSDNSAANGDVIANGSISCDTISPATLTHIAGMSMFVNYKTDGTGDYHLKASVSGSSTCSTGAGAISPCVRTTDFEGVAMNPVPVGAYALVSAASTPTAPTNLTATVQ